MGESIFCWGICSACRAGTLDARLLGGIQKGADVDNSNREGMPALCTCMRVVRKYCGKDSIEVQRKRSRSSYILREAGAP